MGPVKEWLEVKPIQKYIQKCYIEMLYTRDVHR